MLILSNQDIARLLDVRSCIEALRKGYNDLAAGDAAYIPRIDLYAPTGRKEDYYRWGSMSGVSRSHGVTAVRMKSDIVFWPDGKTEDKYCKEPGTYCGLILLFSISTAEPLALLQDGYLQHLRVGASAALGADLLARKDAETLGMLGSGGMARTYLEAICAVRQIRVCNVYSPTAAHRESYAREMSQKLGIEVVPVDRAEDAVRNCDIVATTTNSLQPTFAAEWVSPGTHLTCVSRRELSDEVFDRVDVAVQLGYNTILRQSSIPGMHWLQGGFASYICGQPEERNILPPARSVESRQFPTLMDLVKGRYPGRTSSDQISFFITTGTQGLQFAAVGGYVLQRAKELGLGTQIPDSWFLQDIKD